MRIGVQPTVPPPPHTHAPRLPALSSPSPPCAHAPRSGAPKDPAAASSTGPQPAGTRAGGPRVARRPERGLPTQRAHRARRRAERRSWAARGGGGWPSVPVSDGTGRQRRGPGRLGGGGRRAGEPPSPQPQPVTTSKEGRERARGGGVFPRAACARARASSAPSPVVEPPRRTGVKTLLTGPPEPCLQ